MTTTPDEDYDADETTDDVEVVTEGGPAPVSEVQDHAPDE